MTGYCIYQNYFLPLSQQLKITVMEISYICPCDKQTLKLLLFTAKDNVKAYNDIIDMQNELYNEVYLRNTLIAKTMFVFPVCHTAPDATMAYPFHTPT